VVRKSNLSGPTHTANRGRPGLLSTGWATAHDALVRRSVSQATSRHHVCTEPPHLLAPYPTARTGSAPAQQRIGSEQSGGPATARQKPDRPAAALVNLMDPPSHGSQCPEAPPASHPIAPLSYRQAPSTPNRPHCAPNACLIAAVNKDRAVTVGCAGRASRSGRAALSPSVARGTRWNLARGGTGTSTFASIGSANVCSFFLRLVAPLHGLLVSYWHQIEKGEELNGGVGW
jgi:hypothetical protein